MAQRFGGKYSPDPAVDKDAANGTTSSHPPIIGPPQSRGDEWRAEILAVAGLFLFAVNGLLGEPRVLILGLAAAATMIAASWLTRQGARAQAAYNSRRVARRPALPRKIFGAALTGVALGLGTMMWQPGFVFPILIGLAGTVLHLGAFGLDPLADKGAAGIDQFQTDRVARAVDEAEALLAGMKDAIMRAKDRGLETRVDRFAATARTLFRTVEGDPGDLTAARKYLSVYLMGARDATVKFADVFAQTRAADVRSEYEALLNDLETNFASRTQTLLSGANTDLDVEIQVLRERLKLES